MGKPLRMRAKEWEFFLDENNKIKFNPICEGCKRECKQSFRATIIQCPVYEKKEAD